MPRKKKTVRKKPDKPEPMVEADDDVATPSVWIPGRDALEEGEDLQYDPTAYDCMSAPRLGCSCLSFDVVRREGGDNPAQFPLTVFMVAGTQAMPNKQNYLAVMKVSNLTQGRHGAAAAAGSDSDDDMQHSGSDTEDAEDARLHVRKVAHTGCINRVRCMPQNPAVVASWSETGQVQTWDLSAQLAELDAEEQPVQDGGKVQKSNALHVHRSVEGYALDWSPVSQGWLATGNCKAHIHLWAPREAGGWQVGGAMKGHTDSVEDIQWHPDQPDVFASASVDRTIRIWDARAPDPKITVEAHATDVNVISWNRLTLYLLASGGDDGVLRVWDLRMFGTVAVPGPVADFKHHRGAVTSVEWSPHEASVLCTTSADDTAAVWDLALERDPEEEASMAPDTNAAAPADLPAQLLFVHAGQKELKEVHWHQQIPGLLITTAADGFNLFKPSNV